MEEVTMSVLLPSGPPILKLPFYVPRCEIHHVMLGRTHGMNSSGIMNNW